jgi:hypothetical protein
VGKAGGCAAPAGLAADERPNRDWVMVFAELDETLLRLVLLVVLSFRPFVLLIPFPKLPLPTDPNPDPEPSEGEVACPPGNGTGLDLALSYASKYEDDGVWYMLSRGAKLETEAFVPWP